MLKKLSVVLAAITVCQAHAVNLQTIKDRGYLRVGVADSKPPLSFATDDITGFEPALARDIAQDLLGDPEKIDFVLLETADRVPALQQDKVDFVLSNFTITPKRKQQVDFADPYLKAKIGVLSPKKAPITDLSQLNGKTVIVSKGTIAENYLKTHYPKIKLQVYHVNRKSFKHFGNHEADALAHNNTLLFPWAKKNPDFVVSIPGVGDEVYIAPGVQKGDTELKNYINDEMKKFRQDGRLDAAYNEFIRPAFGDGVKKSDILVE